MILEKFINQVIIYILLVKLLFIFLYYLFYKKSFNSRSDDLLLS